MFASFPRSGTRLTLGLLLASRTTLSFEGFLGWLLVGLSQSVLLCFLEIVMKFLFSLFGVLGLLCVGFAFLGALFAFPPAECLVFLVCGGLLSFVSMLALESL